MQEITRLKRLRTNILISACGLLILFFIFISTIEQKNSLGIAEIWSGYGLLVLLLLLALFNIKKRLSILPLLGTGYGWHQMHIISGMIAIAIYFLHVESWWPPSGYERWIAACFYLAVISGISGLIIQTYYPKRLTEIEEEIIFERIPDAVAEVREKAMHEVESTVAITRSETLLRFYTESLDHYFRRPQFLFSHLIASQSADFWIKKHFQPIRHFCNKDELESLQKLEVLAKTKNYLDQQYAYQLIMKLWLFIHVPSVLALLLFVFWHLLLVNIYAL